MCPALFYAWVIKFFFALVIFEIESFFLPWAALDHDPPINASCVAGMTGTCHHAQFLLVGIGFCELYAHDDLELQSS
jgi:hypothetical protein